MRAGTKAVAEAEAEGWVLQVGLAQVLERGGRVVLEVAVVDRVGFSAVVVVVVVLDGVGFSSLVGELATSPGS